MQFVHQQAATAQWTWYVCNNDTNTNKSDNDNINIDNRNNNELLEETTLKAFIFIDFSGHLNLRSSKVKEVRANKWKLVEEQIKP